MCQLRKKVIPLVVIVVMLLSCSRFKLEKKDLLILKTDGSTTTVRAEIAVTKEEQNYGYMNREKIPEGTGMLFLFEKDTIARFWMKNTPSPLSIAYIDYKGTIRDILDMTPFSEAEVTSSAAVRYALEVPQGWFKKNGIQPGDSIQNLPSYSEEITKKN